MMKILDVDKLAHIWTPGSYWHCPLCTTSSLLLLKWYGRK